MSLTTLTRIAGIGSALVALAAPAAAALYDANPANFGTLQGSPSNCDDCYIGPVAFGGGQTITFFGTTYSDLYIGSNGYVTFGSGQTEYSPVPLDQQNLAPMIAAAFTDLDSRNDASSEVYVNNGTPGQIVATWVSMGHFSQNYGVRSTFQIVVRSSQFAVPSGEGQIGFCYGTVTDGATATAGFGDGLAAVNTGEVAFHNGALSALNNSNCRWYNLGSGGVPITPTGEVRDIPTLSSMGTILLALLLAGAMAVTRRRQD